MKLRNHDLDRRLFLGAAGSILLPACAPAVARNALQDQPGATAAPYVYEYVDYWSDAAIASRKRRATLLGTTPALDKDVRAADAIIKAAPTDSPLSIMRYFAALTAVGSTGEPFNSRWKRYENPVIVKFFHDAGYKPDGDCTSWCAAFLSWTLERAGIKSMRTPSSQKYQDFGSKATVPLPGDVVVFQNVGDAGHGHVGLFLEQTAERIKIIGGNRAVGPDIPSCPKGYPISTIGEDWHDKNEQDRQGKHQFLLTIRHHP